MNVRCAVLHQDADGNPIPCPGHMSVAANIDHEMSYPADVPTEMVDKAVTAITKRINDAGLRGMPGQVFSLRALVGEALRVNVPRSNHLWAVLNALEGLEGALAEASERVPPWIEPDSVRIYLHDMRELLEGNIEPGACGDPECHVLHANPARPIHPPFYVDSRTRGDDK